MRPLILMVVVGCGAAACGPGPLEPGGDPSTGRAEVSPAPGGSDTLALAVGGAAESTGGGLRIEFLEVIEDSRCPTGVPCVWEGRGIARLTVAPAGAPAVVVEIHTDAGREEIEIAGHTVTLLELEPHPEYRVPIPPEAYVVVLEVRRP